jgi:hypothetical protein
VVQLEGEIGNACNLNEKYNKMLNKMSKAREIKMEPKDGCHGGHIEKKVLTPEQMTRLSQVFKIIFKYSLNFD